MEVFWEEFGTVKEGLMMDGRYHELKRRPTRRDMDRLEKGLADLLKELGLKR